MDADGARRSDYAIGAVDAHSGPVLQLFQAAQSILTMLPAVGHLTEIVQTRAGSPHALNWYDYIEDAKRMLGVVINRSDTSFAGGQFEMRRAGSVHPFLSHRYERAGSMMIFAVGRSLEHRVTEVESGGPRCAYAGWFLSEPDHGEVPVRDKIFLPAMRHG